MEKEIEITEEMLAEESLEVKKKELVKNGRNEKFFSDNLYTKEQLNCLRYHRIGANKHYLKKKKNSIANAIKKMRLLGMLPFSHKHIVI